MNAFLKFLNKFKTDDKETITHTRIPNKQLNIVGGSYCIEGSDLDLFYKKYYEHCFKRQLPEFLTEKQQKDGIVLVDLDFRYDLEVDERQHTDDHISDLIDLYLDKIKELIKLKKDDGFEVFVFEKDDIVKTDTETKDGIHFVFGLNLPNSVQLGLREMVIDEAKDILEELPLTNDLEKVFDECIPKGTTNWQLYGSQKPGNIPYKLKQAFYFSIDEEGDFVEDKINIEKLESDYKFLYRVTAQNPDGKIYPLSEFGQTMMKKYENNKPKKPKIQGNEGIGGGGQVPPPIMMDMNIQNSEQLDNMLNLFFENINQEDYKLKEIHDYTMILEPKFYENFDHWMRVGWALHNTDNRLFLTWIKFSSQWDKFNFIDIPELWEKWQDMRDNGLTELSLYHWAKQSNKDKFDDIRLQSIDYFIQRIIESPTEFDIAVLVHQLYKHEFVCISIANKSWYQFRNHRWFENDNGTSLRKRLSTEIVNILVRHKTKIDNELIQVSMMDDDDENDEKKEKMKHLESRSKKIKTVIGMVKKTASKNNIMRELMDLFYDHQFLNKLDNNPMLLGFKNGVFDFRTNDFRDGFPDDYISMTTGINYIALNKNDSLQKKKMEEIENFIYQLFPDDELRKYMWEHLASILLGVNLNQVFSIYNGKGRNGKSILIDLLATCLGQYKGSVPISLVTQKRTQIGGVSPEIAQLKGIRLAVMQEPSKNQQLNEGIMKELTGGDPLSGRLLRQNTITFIPQFTLVVCTNNLFDIKSNDEGTWRRIRVIEFKSYFTENPDKEDKYQFLIDKNLKENKFDEWKEQFISMLIEIAKEKKGNVTDCDMVMQKSNEYRKKNDIFMKFIEDKIVEEKDSCIRKQDIIEEFKNWFMYDFGGDMRYKPKDKDLFEYLENIYGKYHKIYGWQGYKLVLNEII